MSQHHASGNIHRNHSEFCRKTDLDSLGPGWGPHFWTGSQVMLELPTPGPRCEEQECGANFICSFFSVCRSNHRHQCQPALGWFCMIFCVPGAWCHRWCSSNVWLEKWGRNGKGQWSWREALALFVVWLKEGGAFYTECRGQSPVHGLETGQGCLLEGSSSSVSWWGASQKAPLRKTASISPWYVWVIGILKVQNDSLR